MSVFVLMHARKKRTIEREREREKRSANTKEFKVGRKILCRV